MQELAWLLEAEQNETRRLQEELAKAREESHISLAEHHAILQEELGKQKAETDAAPTLATKNYIEDLVKLERMAGVAEQVVQELAEQLEKLAVGICGKFHFILPLSFSFFACCNIPSFQNSEKSEKFKTFSNYMYFVLKRNFMHCMHHHLVLFAFCLFKRLEYNFPIPKSI